MNGLNFNAILWDRDDDPNGNVQHIAKHNLSKEDVEGVFDNPTGRGISRSTGRPIIFGETAKGKYIMVAYETVDASTVYLTATNIEIGLLLNFGAPRLEFKRKSRTYRPSGLAEEFVL